MPLAAFDSLCLDALDVERVGTFWAAALGASFELRDDGVGVVHHALLAPLWINPVPELKTVKNRVHLDLLAPSTDALVELGATVIADRGRFQVLHDVEGNELCVFPGAPEDGAPAEPFAVCVDSDRPVELAQWWAAILGGRLDPGPDGALRWLSGAAGMDGLTLKFVHVTDARVVKNRCHWDVVTDDLDALVAHGAVVVRPEGGDIRWSVMADPDGNEFCAFTS